MRATFGRVSLLAFALLCGAASCSPPDDPGSTTQAAGVVVHPIPGIGIPLAKCVGHPTACDDGNPCTVDVCRPLLGCVHKNKGVGAACDDGNPCTTGDACTAGGTCAGSSISCDDGNPCTVDQCDPGTGTCQSTVAVSAPCDDGNRCTTNDSCTADGSCSGSAVSCDDGNPCTADQCAPDTGLCVNTIQALASCDDGDACTTEDRCTAAGACVGTELPTDDGNGCTVDSCDPQLGIRHDPAMAGTTCVGDDGTINMLCDGQARCVGPLLSESAVARVNGQDDLVDERRLGNGRHPVAASEEGFAVSFVEALQGGGARVGVATYSPGGTGLGLWRYDGVPYEADPVIAAVPGGFVVAFNALTIDGDGLGIALARLGGDGSILAGPVAADTTVLLSQHSPDVLWDGTSLLVGWEDDSMTESWERRICSRAFTANLSPLGTDQCAWTAGANRSTVSYAATSSGTAMAWREETTDSATLQLSYAGSQWAIALTGFPGPAEPVALLELDASHLLMVYSDTGGSQMATIVDSAVGPGSPNQLNPAPMLHRVEPSLAKTDDGIYLAWREPATAPDSYLDDVWVQKAEWDGAALSWIGAPVSIPRPNPLLQGDRTRPALASEPFVPSGALVAAWNDLTSRAGSPPHGDVLLSLLPTPMTAKE